MKKRILTFVSLLISALLLTLLSMAGAPPVASAQCGGGIRAGQSVSGRIPRAGTSCSYTFSGRSGEAVTIKMVATSGSLDPYLRLKDPGNNTVDYDDDSAGNRNSLIEYRLARSGTYTIIAGSYNNASYGGFTLRLDISSSSSGDSCGGWIEPDESVEGRIARRGQRCEYMFEGSRNDEVYIYMIADSSSLDPWLDLVDPRGVRVAYDDDGYGNRNSKISYELERSGTYTIIARTYNDASYGDFELYLYVE